MIDKAPGEDYRRGREVVQSVGDGTDLELLHAIHGERAQPLNGGQQHLVGCHLSVVDSETCSASMSIKHTLALHSHHGLDAQSK